MLDDLQVLSSRDAADALGVAAKQWQQANYEAEIKFPEHDGRQITSVVLAGMGGSALAAVLAKSWLVDELSMPFEIIRSYSLPRFVGPETLVICSSYSGNTEETVACLAEAKERGAQIAVLSAGGELIKQAQAGHISHVEMPSGLQPRMALIYNLRALIKTLVHFDIIDGRFYDDIASYADWLREQSETWHKEVTTDKNVAKQLALMSVGKTPVIYAGHTMAPVAYKWKISWNENAKNTAFYNELPEFNHNEFIGWASHPIEKPFVIFDLVSNFENERILKRFEISDRLLSGKRPKANIVSLQGETILAQMLWGCILADFVSIYVAILNGVDPTPVNLIEKFKLEMNQ